MNLSMLKSIHSIVKGVSEETFYIAGGAVVDTLYGKEPKDYDLVLPTFGWNEMEAFHFLEELSSRFSSLGFNTKVYQSYGLNLGDEVDFRLFQANFLGCMKVQMNNCQLYILISKYLCMTEHVLHHDCNMNMVWFNGDRICWEHGGNTPEVSELLFCDNIPEERKSRMIKKWEILHGKP